jgi:hypothetical protein
MQLVHRAWRSEAGCRCCLLSARMLCPFLRLAAVCLSCYSETACGLPFPPSSKASALLWGLAAVSIKFLAISSACWPPCLSISRVHPRPLRRPRP